MYINQWGRVGMRGDAKTIFIKRAKLNLRKHFFTQQVVDVWNKLPKKMIIAPSVNSFEKRLDEHWRNQSIVYNFESLLTSKNDHSKQNLYKKDEDLDIED